MSRAWDLLAALACAVALAVAVQTVDGLQWPPDEDNFRDVAAAQVALDGHPLSDPFYSNEWIWYNPLVPWLVAAGSAIARVPPAVFNVQSGPWLNLLGPIGFYLLSAYVAGRGAAFVALLLFLFWNGGDDVMASPTYVPWLFVGHFSQGPFYLALLAILWSSEKPTRTRASVVGLAGGLMFLTHTAPAVLVGLVAVILLPLRLVALAGAIAIVVASPFLYAIVGQYRLRVINDAPMAWQYAPVTLQGLPALLQAHAPLIVAGAIGALWSRHAGVLAALLVSMALLAYGLGRELFPAFPALVPVFHFWRFALGLLTVFAGFALWRMCRGLGDRRAFVLIGGMAAVTVWLNLASYRQRDDFAFVRHLAARRDPGDAAVSAALRDWSRSRDVVLGSELVGLEVIGPAGRKAVAVGAIWSNPYVKYEPRQRDLEGMLSAIRARDQVGFRTLASRYGVTRVVGMGEAECQELSGPPLMLIIAVGNSCIYAVAPDD